MNPATFRTACCPSAGGYFLVTILNNALAETRQHNVFLQGGIFSARTVNHVFAHYRQMMASRRCDNG